MNNKDSSKACSRADLKKKFLNGSIPSETDFSSLIDSMINKQDDGFSKDENNGFIIKPIGSSSRLLSLYKNINDLSPFFIFEKDDKEDNCLKLNPVGDNNYDITEDKSFFLSADGSLGIGKRPEGGSKIDVDGFITSKGHIGSYKSDKVLANGQWHTIIDNLDYCSAFEIVARTGKIGSGRFAILHAFAMSAFGKSRSRIRKTSAYYGYFWNKINLRWRGSTHNYSLQIRTNSNYGKDINIFYKVKQLWDDKLFMPNEML